MPSKEQEINQVVDMIQAIALRYSANAGSIMRDIDTEIIKRIMSRMTRICDLPVITKMPPELKPEKEKPLRKATRMSIIDSKNLEKSL